MTRPSVSGCGLFVGALGALSALLLTPQARAGFSAEDLAGFEVTHLRGVATVVLPDEKVIEVIRKVTKRSSPSGSIWSPGGEAGRQG